MPYPSNIHIHHLNAYIYTAICNVNHDNAILIRLQNSFSLIRAIWRQQSCNRAGECLRGGVIACVMDRRNAIKSCVTQRSAVLRGGARAEYSIHTKASAVSRGGAEHTSSRQSPIWDSDWEGVLESVYSRVPGWAHNYQPLHYTAR